MLHLTDLGLAAASLLLDIAPEDIARRQRLRGRDLHAAITELPQLVAAYEVLDALCSSQLGRPNLIVWERPWRRRFQTATAKTLVTVCLPAYVELNCGASSRAALLLPDLATSSLRAYRTTIQRLLALRAAQGGCLPPLVVVASDDWRAAAWERMLQDTCRARRDAPVHACIASRRRLAEGLAQLSLDVGSLGKSSVGRMGSFRPSPQKSRLLCGPIPRPVSGSFAGAARGKEPRTNLGALAIDLTQSDRDVLDFVGRHPFLTVDEVSAVFGWTPEWAVRRCNRLRRVGLLCLSWPAKSAAPVARTLLELTADGLALVAAQQGFTLAAALRYNGLGGGGSEQPLGTRRGLARDLAHTLGVNATFVGLYRCARVLADLGFADAVLEWRNAASCAHHYARPDSYGIYRHKGKAYGFFLEYDRGTMSARNYRDKFTAYHEFLASRRYERDYVGFPTILVIARDNAAEERLATAIESTSIGRAVPLPVLLTAEWRINDVRNGRGMLGPIWREASAAINSRRLWPLGIVRPT